MVVMDRVDNALLHELELDSRQPFSKIGKKLRMSKESVKYRFDALKRKGVISGTTVFSNLPKLGFLYIKVYFQFRGLAKGDEKRLLDYLQMRPEVVWLADCFGKYDLIINGVFADLPKFDLFMDEFLTRFGKFVELRDTCFISDLRRLSRSHLSGRQVAVSIATTRQKSIDEVDLEILSMLSRDARLSSQALGLKVGLTGPAVRERIKKLIKSGHIGRFTVNVNYRAFNYTFVKVMLRLQAVNGATRRKFLTYCENLPGLFYTVVGTGVSDMDLDFEVEDLKSFQGTLRKIKSDFPDLIREYELLIVSNERKLDLAGGLLAATKAK